MIMLFSAYMFLFLNYYKLISYIVRLHGIVFSSGRTKYADILGYIYLYVHTYVPFVKPNNAYRNYLVKDYLCHGWEGCAK
jgi:hypothetical protein